jgi:hypothetical protein
MRLHVVPGSNPVAIAAFDLARAASAVVCTPVAYARFTLGPGGEVVEAFHGLGGSETARSGAKPALERLAALVRGFDPRATEIHGGGDAAPEDERAFATLAFLAGGVARELEERLVRIAEGSEALRAHRGTGDSRVAASVLGRDAARALELLRHLRALVEAKEAA